MPRIVTQFIIFIVYLLSQVLLFNYFTLGEVARPFVFLIFLMLLPISVPISVSMAIGFATGLLVDVFSYNMFAGLNAFSCVLMMAIRPYWIQAISMRNAQKGNEDLFLVTQPIGWYLYYFAVLILIHHFSYFFLEAFGFAGFGRTLLKTLLSGMFTFGMSMGITYLFYLKPERR